MSAALFTPPPRGPVSTAALALGAQIGPFTVLQLLHEGPHGCVYLTRDPAQGITRVLKEFLPRKHALRRPDGDVMPRDAGDSIAMAVARLAFAEEANALAAIEQPGLVRVLGLLNVHHTLYRVMPLYDGVTLERQCLARSAAPTVKWVAGIVDDLLAALEALHARGRPHGRVQPDQVLVSETQRATLLGFGSVARELDEGAAPPPWRAPEGDGADRHFPPRQAGDIYALAATAWFAATGGAPPTAEQRSSRPWNARVQLAALVDGPDDAPQLRRGLVEAIDSGLALRGRERPQTLVEFRHLLRGEPSARTVPFAPAPPQAGAVTVPGAVSDAAAPPIEVAEGAAAAPAAPVAPATPREVGEVVPIANVRATRATLAARVAARRTHAAASMPLLQPRPPHFEVPLATPPEQATAALDVVAVPGATAAPRAAARVESERTEPWWLDTSMEAAGVPPSGEALPDGAAVAEVVNELPRAAEPAARVPPRRTAMRATALAALALAGAGVALTWWVSSPPGAGLWFASSPLREVLDRAAPLPDPTAPAVVSEAASMPPRALAAASQVAADTPLAQTIDAPPAVVAAAPAPPAAVLPAAPTAAGPAMTQARPGVTPTRSAARRTSASSMSARAPGPTAKAPALRAPAAVCSKRTQFSFVYCMRQQCAKPALRHHRQCIEMRRND